MTAALDHCVYRLVTPQRESLKRSADELASADSSEAADAPASGLSVLEQLAANSRAQREHEAAEAEAEVHAVVWCGVPCKLIACCGRVKTGLKWRRRWRRPRLKVVLPTWKTW